MGLVVDSLRVADESGYSRVREPLGGGAGWRFSRRRTDRSERAILGMVFVREGVVVIITARKKKLATASTKESDKEVVKV